MSEGGAAQPSRTSAETRPPESLQRAVADAEQAIPPGERGRTLTQPGFKAEQARQTPVVTIRAYLRDLQGKSREAQGHLDTLGERIAAGPGEGRYEKRPSEKDFRASCRRSARRKATPRSSAISLPGRVVYPTMEKLSAGLAQTAKALEGTGATIVRVKERFSDPMASGYRDVLMNIRIDLGPEKGAIVTELRFELEPLLRISEGEHLPYEIKRGLDDLASREKRALTREERRLKDTLDRIAQADLRRGLRARARPGGARPRVAATPRSRPRAAVSPAPPASRYGAGARRRSAPPLPAAHNVPSGADQIAFNPAGPAS